MRDDTQSLRKRSWKYGGESKGRHVFLLKWSLECWWVSKSDMRGGGDDFLVSLRIL